eukprot:566816-Prymnesium_polylepis.2
MARHGHIDTDVRPDNSGLGFRPVRARRATHGIKRARKRRDPNTALVHSCHQAPYPQADTPSASDDCDLQGATCTDDAQKVGRCECVLARALYARGTAERRQRSCITRTRSRGSDLSDRTPSAGASYGKQGCTTKRMCMRKCDRAARWRGNSGTGLSLAKRPRALVLLVHGVHAPEEDEVGDCEARFLRGWVSAEGRVIHL